MTVCEFGVVVITETAYLCSIILLTLFRMISINFLSSKTVIVIIIINLIFYQFVDMMNILFLITKKPENIKVILLAGFTCMFFVIYIPAYFFFAFDVTYINLVYLIIGAGMFLLIIYKIKIHMLNNKFKERITLSFKE